MSTTINFQNGLAQHEAAQAATDQRRKNDIAWEQVLQTWPIAGHHANRSMVEDYCGGEITLAKVEFLLQNQPKGFQLDFSDDRQTLLDQIVELLTDPFGRTVPAATMQARINPYRVMNRAQLRAAIQQLTEAKANRAKSAPQIRAEMQAADEANRKANFGYTDKRGMQWPRILKTMVPPGQIQAVPSGQYIRDLGKSRDVNALYQFKRLIKIYGVDQINHAMQNME